MKKAEESGLQSLRKRPWMKEYQFLVQSASGRIIQYLRFFSLLAESFCLLHNRKLRPEECEAFYLVAALGPLFDDLFDEGLASPDDIMRVTANGTSLKTDSKSLQLYAQVLSDLTGYVSSQADFSRTAILLSAAQAAAHQLGEKGGAGEVLHLTNLRGGLTAMLCRCLYAEELLDGEEKMLKQVGYLAQLTDDLFDYPDDRADRRLNAVLVCHTLEQLKELYADARLSFVRLLGEVAVGKRSRARFHAFLRVPFATFYTALGHYSKLDPAIDPGYDRNKLPVCDMETPRHQLATLLNVIRN